MGADAGVDFQQISNCSTVIAHLIEISDVLKTKLNVHKKTN